MRVGEITRESGLYAGCGFTYAHGRGQVSAVDSCAAFRRFVRRDTRYHITPREMAGLCGGCSCSCPSGGDELNPLKVCPLFARWFDWIVDGRG